MMRSLQSFRWTVPNALSIFRMACAPAMVALAAQHSEWWFVVLFVLAQISDILDGMLARMLHQESELGALLDSYADLGSYIAAVAGLAAFHPEMFRLPYGAWVIAFLALYVAALAIAKLKFGRLVAGLHLYSSKVTGYLQGAFLVVLFCCGMVPAFFYLMMVAGLVSQAEVIIINLASRRPALNAKGLYWLLRDKRLTWKRSSNP